MVNILARILDSERNFNGSADPMTTADRGFIRFLGSDFGFWLLGSSDRGSQRFPGNLTFLPCAVSFLIHLIHCKDYKRNDSNAGRQISGK